MSAGSVYRNRVKRLRYSVNVTSYAMLFQIYKYNERLLTTAFALGFLDEILAMKKLYIRVS